MDMEELLTVPVDMQAETAASFVPFLILRESEST